MSDSLVRVSRRVGWGADRFATDLGRSPRARSRQRSGAHAVGRAPTRGRSAPGDAPRSGGSGLLENLPASPPTRGVRARSGPVFLGLAAAGTSAGCKLPAVERASKGAPRRAGPPSRTASRRRETGRGALPAEITPFPAGSRPRRPSPTPAKEPNVRPPSPSRCRARAESRESTARSHPFACERFHVLLNSLSKVLFSFPSTYLCAVGLVQVFSLRWSLPPALGCILKQPDSEGARVAGRLPRRRGLTPALGWRPRSGGLGRSGSGPQRASQTPQFPSPVEMTRDSALGSSRFTRRY